nr:hypothetical protein [Sicyoidochytrium minutum DNA virus]
MPKTKTKTAKVSKAKAKPKFPDVIPDSELEQMVVVDGMAYANKFLKNITHYAFDKSLNSKDLALQTRTDLRLRVATPAIFTALKVLHRVNAYFGIAAIARDNDKTPVFPPSRTPVDYTVKHISKTALARIDQITKVEADWKEENWNPYTTVHKMLEKILEYNFEVFFGLEIENESF